MRILTILFALLIALTAVGETASKRPKRGKRYEKTRRSARHLKHHKKAKIKVVKKITPIDPRLNDPDFDPFLQCEDTCSHVHGIDLSHYQGKEHPTGAPTWFEGGLVSLLPSEDPVEAATR